MKLTELKSSLPTLDRTSIVTKEKGKKVAVRPMIKRKLTGKALQSKRLEIWQSVGGKCQECSDAVDLGQFHLDHIIPIHLGGGDKDDNLQVLCIPCHEAKTADELKAFYK